MKKYLSSLFVIVATMILLASTAFASADYTITDIKLTDLTASPIEYTSGSCMVNVSVTKNANVADGYVVISSYTADGTLIGFNYLHTSLDAGQSATLGALVAPPDGTAIGKVKATVWNSLSGMTPLAESKILVPGGEIEGEPSPTPTPTPTPEPTKTTINGALINDQSGSYPGVDVINVNQSTIGVIRIKKSASLSQSKATEYNIKNAELYVNGVKYCDVNSDTAADVQKLLKKSTGLTTLAECEDEEDVYNKIYMDYYVIASVNSIKTVAEETEIRIINANYLGGQVSNPGTLLAIAADDLAEGRVTVNVKRNGEACEIADIAENDVVALKYNIKQPLSGFGTVFDEIDIIATSATVSGQYMSYDSNTELYGVSGIEYTAVSVLNLSLGSTYTFRLDPFGRLFDAEEDWTTINYAIVEKYVDMTLSVNAAFDSEYDFLDVVTLDGQVKRLYIDPDARMSVRGVMASANIGSNQTSNATTTYIGNRIIEYKVKSSTGRVTSLAPAYSTSFASEKYDKSINKLSKPLNSKAVVLDATYYDACNPSSNDYVSSSLLQLTDGVEYDGVLLHQRDNGEYCYVILTNKGVSYIASTDFVVLAAKASAQNSAIVDDEEVYQLDVMQNGDNAATKLNVSTSAKVYSNGTEGTFTAKIADLKEGSVFYYTTDSYGLVDRIDVVLVGGYDYDDVKALTNTSMTSLVKTPATTEVKANTWFVNVDEKANTATDEQIQLFIAPVMTAGTSNITFGTMATDATGLYVDTNADYGFSLADNAKIYEYDLGEIGTGKNAFRGGAFVGFDIGDATAAGNAYMVDVAGETNFDGMVQYAFCMAVDGVITNALLLND